MSGLPDSRPAARPSLWTRILLFISFFVLIQIPPVLLLGFQKLPASSILGRSLLAVGYIAGYALVIWLVWLALKRVTTGPIWRRLTGPDWRMIAIGWIGFFVIEIGLNMLNQLLFSQTETANNQAIIDLLKSDHWTFYLLMFSGVVMSPILEELLFRGYLVNAFFKTNQFWWPVIFSGVAFSIGHASSNPVSFLIYACLGGILATVYLKTNNLTTSIGVHMLNNAIAMAGMAVMLR